MQQQRERDRERASNRAKQRERERERKKKDTERGDRLQAPCASTMVCGFSDRDRVCRMPKIT